MWLHVLALLPRVHLVLPCSWCLHFVRAWISLQYHLRDLNRVILWKKIRKSYNLRFKICRIKIFYQRSLFMFFTSSNTMKSFLRNRILIYFYTNFENQKVFFSYSFDLLFCIYPIYIFSLLYSKMCLGIMICSNFLISNVIVIKIII